MSLMNQLRQHAELPFEHARMLPLAAYQSSEMLESELSDLFGRDWLCVGRAADVPSIGDYVTAEIPGPGGDDRSLVVVRSDDGELRVFDNMCVHRGARLVDGCGTAARLTCPYHAWVYRTDGTLVGAPHMGDSTEVDGQPFDPSRHSLAGLPVEVWEGFVFVNQHARPMPLAEALAGLSDVVDRYAIADYVPVHEQVDVWNTNWKLLVENFMDAYHVFKVHKDSFGSTGDSTADTHVYPGTDHWTHHRAVEERGPDLAHPGNTRLSGLWRKTTVLAAVFPGLVVQLQPDWMWFLRITPIGTDRVRIAWQVAVAPEVLADQADPDRYVAQLLALIDQVNAEDRPIIEGVRRNIVRPQFDPAPLSFLERNVYDFDRYICRRLTGVK